MPEQQSVPLFDVNLALSFLQKSRSRFLQEAALWLADFSDPIDVLFSLAGETGQALGPWESARFCSLLGLSPSASVQSLFKDVLSEPLSDEPAPPISAAMAVAHAHDVLPNEPAPFAREWVLALDGGRENASVHPCLIDAALLSLCAKSGAFAEPQVEEAAIRSLTGWLNEAPQFATSVLEAALLAAQPALAEKALFVLGQEQSTTEQSRGSICGLERHPLRQGFITLRAVALSKRHLRQKN